MFLVSASRHEFERMFQAIAGQMRRGKLEKLSLKPEASVTGLRGGPHAGT
jgi:hypothetical protein